VDDAHAVVGNGWIHCHRLLEPLYSFVRSLDDWFIEDKKAAKEARVEEARKQKAAAALASGKKPRGRPHKSIDGQPPATPSPRPTQRVTVPQSAPTLSTATPGSTPSLCGPTSLRLLLLLTTLTPSPTAASSLSAPRRLRLILPKNLDSPSTGHETGGS
jgi:hypothetical protein